MKRKTWILAALGIVVVGGVGFALVRNGKESVKWRTVEMKRGDVTQRISATGTVNAMVQVAVGTQVSGVISALYADYNSLVKRGQIIAQIDPTVWETQLKDAQATLERATANMEDARRQYERAKRLAAEKLLSDQDLDARMVAFKTARASMENAQAALERATANLGYCNITAPVDGVVIARMADVGQTVAASFSTPNLFQIAQDLSKMKLEVSIDEADIDEVAVGQKAFFTVDSLPEKQFVATVSQVRLEPTTTQNVVTYKVVLEVPNEPLPGSRGQGGPASPAGRRAVGDAARAQGAGPADDRDPEAIWARMKDRIQERNPGITKEAWIQRMKQRVAEGGMPGGGMRRGGAEPARAAEKPLDPQAAARTPGGVAFLGGPTFAGNLALRPGMTANVTIMTDSRRDVLRVPNAALRFNPAAFQKDEKKAEGPRLGGLGQPMMMPGRPGGGARTGNARPSGMAARREERIWVLEQGQPKALTVTSGLTDGQFTEVSGEGLAEGLQVLVGVEDTKKPATATAPNGAGGGRR